MTAPEHPSLLNLASLLTICHRQVSARLAAELKSSGLTVDMWMVLGLLADKPGRSMTEISEATGLNLPTATKLMDRMVSDNLVYRRSHHRDRRRVIIFPTEQGSTISSEAQRIGARFEKEMNEEIEDMKTLRTQLLEIIDSMWAELSELQSEI